MIYIYTVEQKRGYKYLVLKEIKIEQMGLKT